MLGKLLVEGDCADLPWFDPNTLNLVAEVSIKVINDPSLTILLFLTILTALSRRSGFITRGVGQGSVLWTVGSK